MDWRWPVQPGRVKGVGGFELDLRLTATGVLIADGVLAVVCVLKGKYRTALFGLSRRPSRWSAPCGWPALRRSGPGTATGASACGLRYPPRRRLRPAWTPLQTHWVNFAGGKPHLPSLVAAPEQLIYARG